MKKILVASAMSLALCLSPLMSQAAEEGAGGAPRGHMHHHHHYHHHYYHHRMMMHHHHHGMGHEGKPMEHKAM